MQTHQVELPDQLFTKLDRMAHELERSPSWIMRQALESWFEREDFKLRGTLEAMADVDAGRLVDHDQVLAWVESWGTSTELPRPDAKQ